MPYLEDGDPARQPHHLPPPHEHPPAQPDEEPHLPQARGLQRQAALAA